MYEEVLLSVLGLCLCVVLGSNNASVCFGASVGSGITNYSLAAIIAALGVFLGTVLEGPKLSGAVSGGVLDNIGLEMLLIVLVVNLTMLSFATYFRIPLSLSHSLVGSAVGVALGAGVPVNWGFASAVILSWALTPFVGTLIAIFTYIVFVHVSRNIKNPLTLDYLYSQLSLVFTLYISYVLGANSVGLVNGVFVGCSGKQLVRIPIFGLAAALGMLLFGRRLAEVVGGGIIELSPLAGLTAQFSSAFTVHLFTQFGLPVSITQALLGGVLGTGLAKRVVMINKSTTMRVVSGWFLVPLVGFVSSYLMLKIF